MNKSREYQNSLEYLEGRGAVIPPDTSPNQVIWMAERIRTRQRRQSRAANQDNALKRALIPFIKALTKAIQTYTEWAMAHRRASNIVVGSIALCTFVFLIGLMMTPVGFGVIMISLLLVIGYGVGDMLNG